MVSLHILPFLSQFFQDVKKKPYTESETGYLTWEKPWQASKWFTLFMTAQWGTGRTTQICEDSPSSGLQLGNKQAHPSMEAKSQQEMLKMVLAQSLMAKSNRR